MQKTTHKIIKKGDVWVVENTNAVGHIQNGIARIQLEYVKYVTD